MPYEILKRTAAAIAIVVLAGAPVTALAQSAADPVQLAPVTVTDSATSSLTVPTTDEARETIQRTPGAVELLPQDVWKDTPAGTLKDVLDYSPGVFVQPKWGEDSRLSIRGSGLSRNFHMRGVQLLQDGVPVNASDGGSDFQEIDPTAFRYTEVYKGANALRYGANVLGGAVNFVSPTGHDAAPFTGRADAGSFGFRRLQASTGGVSDDMDGFVTGSWLTRDGFRDHSAGESMRASGNAGWRISDTAETRFYFNLADIEQEIPGSVTKAVALSSPKQAAASNVTQHYQRNIESWRVANKTTLQFDATTAEFGAYAVNKHLIHPIFQYLDYDYYDFGAFGRAVREGRWEEHDYRLTAGVNVYRGWVDNTQSVNLPGGRKGALLSKSTDESTTTVAYAENVIDVLPDLALVGALQAVYATRERSDEFAPAPDSSGEADYKFLTPKLGFLWDAEPEWQVFGNVSRSGEAPTFSELNFTNTALSDARAQRATTVEIGTRGRRHDPGWDVALYRSHLRNEFQFFDLGGGNFQVTNADRTIHQGIELGIDWTLWKAAEPGGDSIRLNAAYTFSDFRFDGDASWGDNELPGAPRHYLRAEILYRSTAGFYAGPNLEWVPEGYYVDNANTQDTDPYALLGLRAGYEMSEKLSLFLDARNLTDEKYIASTGVAAVATPASALYEPGEGRALFVGIRLDW